MTFLRLIFRRLRRNKTHNNNKYVRHIWEVERKDKWQSYDNGGSFRKCYGNQFYLVDWSNHAIEFYKEKGGLVNKDKLKIEGITWNLITSSDSSFRVKEINNIFSSASPTILPLNYADMKINSYILGFLNSRILKYVLHMFNPTLNTTVGDILNMPIIFSDIHKPEIASLVQQNISISKTDWDSFETSWNFTVHPLLNKEFNPMYLELDTNLPSKSIESAYEIWKYFTLEQFNKLKANEERLNELFIEIYGLEDELTPEITDKDITIAKIFDDKKDIYEDIKGNRYILTKEDVVKSLISYGVGCIFGRYSLDEEGLIFAGGKFDINKYNKFKPVKDNIALITDEEYFEDDLVNKFVEFINISFGEENLEKNLKFIADSLKGKGTDREKIRNYFVNDFYKDHVQMYKKTPIYWLYDSSAGKTSRNSHDGFKALIYMHRYDEDTTGKVRIDYLHKVQRVYERRIDFLRDDIANNSDAKEASSSEKKLEKIIKQVKECKDYDKKIGHIVASRIGIDLDDGVTVNYDKVQTDNKGIKYEILDKI